jgi:hypothetical protein
MQRIYENDLDYDTVRKEILRNSSQFTFKNDEKLLSFYLPEFPENLIQLTPKKHQLFLHNVKTDNGLRDLQIIRALAAKLSNSYPNGANFKICKEVAFKPDLEEKNKKYELINHWNLRLMNLLRDGGKAAEQAVYATALKEQSNDEKLEFSEDANGIFAYGLCSNGFCVKPDGSMFPAHSGLFYQRAPEIIEDYISCLQESGFL